MTELAVVDTHALIWWITSQYRLFGRRAREFVSRVDEGRAAACVSTTSLVEISEGVRAGRIRLSMPWDALIAQLESTPARYQIVPLTTAIVARSHDLYAIPERGDRLIAATAKELGYPLVTRDPEIAAAIGGEQIW
jgi:PIN domain nuclease of toxin-antitoxin system